MHRIASLAGLFLLTVATTASAQVVPAIPVLTDANGEVLGAVLDAGGGGTPSGLATVGMEVDGLRGVLLNALSSRLDTVVVYYASNDCSGTPHVAYVGPVPLGQDYGGSYYQVAGSAGDLFAMDLADRDGSFSYGSIQDLGTCTAAAGMADAVPATLHRVGFEGEFVPPYRIEAASIEGVGAPLSVPAVGGLGLATLTAALLGFGILAIRRRHSPA